MVYVVGVCCSRSWEVVAVLCVLWGQHILYLVCGGQWGHSVQCCCVFSVVHMCVCVGVACGMGKIVGPVFVMWGWIDFLSVWCVMCVWLVFDGSYVSWEGLSGVVGLGVCVASNCVLWVCVVCDVEMLWDVQCCMPVPVWVRMLCVCDLVCKTGVWLFVVMIECWLCLYLSLVHGKWEECKWS